MATTSSTSPVSPSSHFYAQAHAPLTRTDTIDLTGDDDPHERARQIKRPRTEINAIEPPVSQSPTPSFATPSPSPATSQILPNPKQYAQASLRTTPAFSMPSIQTDGTYRPHFNGPSNSSAFFPNRFALSAHASSPTSTGPIITNSQPRSLQQQLPRRQIIDLTASPSPPPSADQAAPAAQLPHNVQQAQHPQTLNVPPKTPVCIGQLTVTALVLYPIAYLEHQTSPAINPTEIDWATVRLQYDAALKQRNPNAEETIHIRTPSTRTLSGEIVAGENFGVVEQKVATVLGPMLGRGLIRLDAKVRRGVPSLPILPLQMLIHTPNGNIPIVSRFLSQSGLLLDDPSEVWDPVRLQHFLYLNPHNPPPGGHGRNIIGSNRTGYNGQGGGKWNTPSVSGKSVEVQRSQVDEVFKSLRSGDELEETEPSSDVATKLYPHQKKALTFLLEREREITGPDGKSSSLWQVKRGIDGHERVWYNFVTQKETTTAPRESKGALLADDMGLGKTITCVSLIASTLAKAREFAQIPLSPPVRPTLDHHNSEPSLPPSHFAGSVWGMPDTSAVSDVKVVKQKAKADREREKLEADYARARRIKVRSRATLIICPLSTVVNWEDQFKEHWAGEVQVVGGGGSSCNLSTQPNGCQIVPSSTCDAEQASFDGIVVCEPNDSTTPSLLPDKRRKGNPLRVYVYHGNARRPDPNFLADFDAVITTYATLATEYSKQNKSIAAQETEDDEEGDSTEGADPSLESDAYGNQMIQLPKAKKGVKRKKNPVLFSGFVEASSPLQSVYWFRVVLDEAHSIKETTTVASRASCDLEADRRLCLTGTPVQNKLDDVFALIKFLRLDPFDDKGTWQEFIGTPVKFGQPLGVARLQTIMKCITLRRTKETKARNGQAILTLPPRRDELRYLKFDEREQQIYDDFFKESRAEFNELSHKNEVMKNYVGILQKILRLRQICDHFELVDGKGPTDSSINYEEIVEAIAKEGITVHRASAIFSLIRDSGTAQCVECGCELGSPIDSAQNENKMEVDGPTPGPAKRGRKVKSNSRAPTRQNSPTAIRPVMTRCQHLFCIHCFQNNIFPQWPNVAQDATHSCTACQTLLTPTDTVELSPDSSMTEFLPKRKPARKEKRQKGVNLENFHPSTKVKALLGDLVNFSRANPYSANYDPGSIEVQMVDDKGNELDDNVVKTVVFSQWTTMLDKIEDALEAAGIRYDRLDGTMKRDDRTRAMEALKFDPGCEVLLVSLKAGGVGLNLTAAQRVYLMDPYWNPAVENQAVDRIHRLGQTRPVTTVKLIIENTIEARLLEVQRKKTELANMTLGQHLSKAEIHSRRMEELNELFHG